LTFLLLLDPPVIPIFDQIYRPLQHSFFIGSVKQFSRVPFPNAEVSCISQFIISALFPFRLWWNEPTTPMI